ncbi:aminotransferase class I/II-fold pyridoxal phosphate-dependent enzyme [Streptomyces iconiensis]|uniref:Aminotransferase class I/II-fold pyridoxal phosphate-dependent enzyme n=1 Tax=Streptomyces iconiensis TaxID=1384038 RepID=A0ABT6ZUE2_9ACTN|nr:aminotransferase class I/II-fold pyridoxal phosphate-dependent enzyme [Streptomyces iconiensis]MDJ1132682.1 aminotransferase class I/II-fold pyridoxal phosphate-dependent enzyme [Streptomyces iconiensis]
MRRTDQGPEGEETPRTPAEATREAACAYWHRRGMPTEPSQVAVAPGAPLLLLAVLAAAGGGGPRVSRAGWGSVLLPRPCSAWYAPQVRLLGRVPRGVPVPAECGGVPDPFVLLETVRRAREEGDEPGMLVLSVADDVTGTAVPPELLHEVCEAATDEGLLVVSDETWRDTSHRPHDTVTVSPAEMLDASRHADADSVVVLAGLGPALLPPGLHAGIARFPRTGRGHALGEEVREVLAALHTDLSDPVGTAAAEALTEPEPLRARRASAARLHGTFAAALHRAVLGVGAPCRPPHVGRQLYIDLEQFRPRLAVLGITDAAGLEAELVRRLGPYAAGGHRFGDDPHALRVRLTTDVLAHALTDAAWARPAGHAAGAGRAMVPEDRNPLELPGAAEALTAVQSALADLTDGSSH